MRPQRVVDGPPDEGRQARVDADNAVAQATAAPPAERRAHSPSGFEPFYRENFRVLMKQALYAGADKAEAEEAAAATMAEVLAGWTRLTNPLAWAGRAVVSNFIKSKKRDQERIHRQKRDYTSTRARRGDEDIETYGEVQWVDGLLGQLSAEQREVMELVVAGYPPIEIADMISISPDAVRQRLMGVRKRLKQVWNKDQAPQSGTGSSGKEAR
jgi:RNA polymerase sigma factor (sigma-70 family)